MKRINKFMVGDRVCVSIDYPSENGCLLEGDTGTIMDIDPETPLPLGVRWDIECSGHNLGGLCAAGYGWWVSYNDVRVIDCEEDYDMPPASDKELIYLFS